MSSKFRTETAIAALILGISGGLSAQAQTQAAEESGGAALVEASAEREGESRLDDIVVTAAGFQQQVVEAPASITLIPRYELEQQRVNSLAEALQNVPGIDVGNGVGKTGGMNISIRGMPSDYTLVLVDGRRQNAAGNVTPNGFGETSSSFIPPVSAIERIEVVRGPMSTLYGSDAMGGVVNILTRTPDEDFGLDIGLDATLQGDDDFGNSYNTTIYADGPVVPGKLAFAARGRYYEREAADLIYEDANGDPIEVSKRGPSPVGAEIWSAGGRLTFTPSDDHRIWFDVDLARQTYDNSEGQLGTLGTRGYADELEFNRDQLVLAYTGDVLGGIVDTDITYNTTETLGRVLPSDVAGTDRLAGDPRELEASNTIYNARYYRSIGDHTFTVGGQYWDAEMVDGVAADMFEHQQWAIFAEDAWQFHEDVALTFGLRMDDHSVFGEHFSPRAYLVWAASEALTLKGGVSRGFKTPGLEQIAPGIIGFRGQGTIPVLGTPSLQPETSTTYEAGAFFDPGAGFSGNVSVFKNVFEDKIASGPELLNCAFGLTEAEYNALTPSDSCVDYGYWPRPATYTQSVNVDEAETQGVEASFRQRFRPDLSLSVNYTYTESEQKSGSSAGEPLVNTPEHQANARLSWDVQDDITLWLRGEFASSRYRGAGDAQDALGDYDAYSLFHLGGSWQVQENVSLGATVYNLFDEDFIQYLPYDRNGELAYSNAYAINQEPRRLWVSLNVTF
ncbi:MAG: TonB-dependent receptor [Ponticaulis sp.]|nr:TonB-dependent receptor [Ponticaulis sp.]